MLSRLMTRKEQAVIVFLAGATIIGGIALYVANGAESESPLVETAVLAPVAEFADDTSTSDSPSALPQEIPRREVVVSLVGAVARPGLYTLDAGSRVQELLLSGGGASADADTSNINLAARLIDGTTLIIPDSDEIVGANGVIAVSNIAEYTVTGWSGGASGEVARASAQSGGRIDLNRASGAQLETLPGIGPVLAAEIIRYRTQTPLTSVSDILNVSGIGPKRFEAIEGLVTVQ